MTDEEKPFLTVFHKVSKNGVQAYFWQQSQNEIRMELHQGSVGQFLSDIVWQNFCSRHCQRNVGP